MSLQPAMSTRQFLPARRGAAEHGRALEVPAVGPSGQALAVPEALRSTSTDRENQHPELVPEGWLRAHTGRQLPWPGQHLALPCGRPGGRCFGFLCIRQPLGWAGDVLPGRWLTGHLLAASVSAQLDGRGQIWMPDIIRQSPLKSADVRPVRGSSTVQGHGCPLPLVLLRAGGGGASSRQTCKAQSLKRGRRRGT